MALDLNLIVNSQIEIQGPSFGVTFTGDIQINGGATLQSSGTTSVISGVISSSGGNSTLGGFALSGANTYSGETTISGSLGNAVRRHSRSNRQRATTPQCWRAAPCS